MAAEPKEARIVVYTGYGTPDQILVRGRVLVDPPEPADAKASLLDNVFHNLDTLESDEVKFAPVLILLPDRQIAGITDADGLFSIPVALHPRPLKAGSFPITVTLGEKPGFVAKPGRGQLLVVAKTPGVAVISDFDDTIVNSHVRNKPRLLWNTLTKNAAQLDAVPKAAEAYRAAQRAGARIFFYLSGSPLQLHDRIETYLARQKFPAGVLLLKNLGDDPLFAQMDYKVGRLEAVLKAMPHLRFVLVGDSGEKDPEIYALVKKAHPKQVAAIVIRRAPGTEGDDRKRFIGMTVIDDYTKQPALLADLVRAAQPTVSPPHDAKR